MEPAVVARPATEPLPFAMSVSTALPSVGPAKKISLAEMQRGVDALKTVEARVSKALDNATAPFGKEPKTWFTRLTDHKGMVGVVAAGVGLVAAGACISLNHPVRADFGYSGYHYITQASWGASVIKAVLLAGFAGAAAGLATYFPPVIANKVLKAEMRRDTLELKHLKAFMAIRKDAEHRPLERAAIGGVAAQKRAALETLKIYAKDDVKAALDASAKDVNLGDDAAKGEAQRHAALINALVAIETGKDLDGPIVRLESALDGLKPEERDGINEELYDRLFSGVVGRNRSMDFDQATRLRTKLGRA